LTAVLVIDAIIAPLPREAQQQAPISLAQSGITNNSGGSPIVSPARALDILMAVLKHPDSTRCPIEVRANICALLGQLCRKGWVGGGERDVEVQKIKEVAKEMMHNFAQGHDLLADAAKRTLEAWG
jgi:hypothetical protein